jgi:putative DNA primase/helicase
MSDFLSAALQYAGLGWRVHPLRPRGKVPLLNDWPSKATTDLDTIRGWWRQWPDANIGLATGRASGCWVLDCDPAHGGLETLQMLEDSHGLLPVTPTCLTGGGGDHRYFRMPAGLDIRNSASALGAGLDVRGEGGQVVAPPSVHPNGQTYLWLEGQTPFDCELADAPGWLLELVAQRATRPAAASAGNGNSGGRVPAGGRNVHLTSLAGRLRRGGMTEVALARALLAENAAVCDPPLPEEEVRGIASSVCRYAPGYGLTDLGNGERFAAAHRRRLFYCFELGQWGAWSGKAWRLGDEVAVRRAADETTRLIHLEAANTTDPDRRKAIARWAIQSESRQRIAAMLELAKHHMAVAAADLDQQPDLLTCENGVIDLRSGALLPYDPELRLTKKVAAAYDPEAGCPQWLSFMEMITCGDGDLEHFLQVAAGYSLTGRTDEQCFFLLFGLGKNGKTTFVETLRRLLGDFAVKISVEALLAHRNGNGATPDLANLRGARFALATEIPQGRALNEALIKDATGSDALVARHLYGNPFTFQPSHKLWVYGNHKPRIKGDDAGVWRRVKIVPFRAIIPSERQRPMSDVLADFWEERAGILAWAVAGAIQWYANGLPRCVAVDQETEAYRTESDQVTQFLSENCETDAAYRMDKAGLYKAFCDWLGDQYGEKAPGQRWFTTRLLERGYQLGGNGRGHVVGLRLKQNA